MKSEQKRLHYKLITGTSDGTSFQQLLAAALKQLPIIKNRTEEIGLDGSMIRFVNVHQKSHGVLVGSFHKVSKGAAQQTVDMEDNATEWRVTQFTANDPNHPTREFLDGTLFFGVWKNHLLVLQSVVARAEQFRDHANWLFAASAKSRKADPNEQITLVDFTDPLPPKLRKKKGQQVRSVRMGGSVPMSPQTESDESSPRVKTVRTKLSNRIWEKLKEVFEEEEEPLPDLGKAKGEEGGNLRVALEISVTQKGLATTAGKLLGEIQNRLADEDLDGTSYTLDDGTIIKGNEMRVSADFPMDCDGHHPTFHSVASAMVEYFVRLSKSGTIAEDNPFGNA